MLELQVHLTIEQITIVALILFVQLSFIHDAIADFIFPLSLWVWMFKFIERVLCSFFITTEHGMWIKWEKI